MAASYTFIKGKSPIVATAIHEGHHTRAGLKELFHLDEDERLREEDPYTARWLNVSDNRIIVHHSRFETDVNRPREKAVYRVPEDAWGLNVWKQVLNDEIAEASLRVYDNFYEECKGYFDSLFKLNNKIIVYDIHSYNHRREGRTVEAEPNGNPEINIGTQNMDRQLWDPVIETLLQHFSSFNYNGRNLDARENIKFKGGYFGQWLYERYGKNICPVSIEVKKFFMDEWTGEAFPKDIQLIDEMLRSSGTPVLEAMNRVNT
ncbi:N-formylglutamate amidohydrolase [Flavihumibacter sp. R14]|nr:N-formylglutamate amidohydrolase [Flavihumibacter soli]